MALTQVSTQGIKDGTITGTDLATNIDLVDNQRIRLGTGNDLQIYHDGTNSYILENGAGGLNIKTNGTSIDLTKTPHENLARFIVDGAVELYYNNTKRFETNNTGAFCTGELGCDTLYMGDNEKAKFGNNDDLQIYHDGTNDRIDSAGTYLIIEANNHIFRNPAGNEDYAKFLGNGAVELYHDNTLRAYTTNAGLHVNTIVSVSDNGKFRCGNGDDLEIYHDGSHSYIDESSGTGRLKIRTGGMDITSEAGAETIATFNMNGAVELYHDNSKKFETLSGGGQLTGSLNITNELNFTNNGNKVIDFATLNGSNTVTLRHQDGSTFETAATFTANGGAALTHNGTTKFATTSAGVQVTGALNVTTTMHIPDGSIGLQIGSSNDLKLYHDGTNTYIHNTTGFMLVQSNNFAIRSAGGTNKIASGGDEVTLFYGASGKLATTASGVSIAGDLALGDNNRAKFGDGNDLQIYHNGTNNIIAGFSAGDINIESYFGADVNIITNSNHYAIKCISNAQVELYYDNSRKFMTESTGVKAFGIIVPSANNTHDLGTSSLRWRNVYTNDLNLSNEGGSNDVDGTWGSYTIQEGDESLFLINKRNGKKYKFNLTEVK